MSREHGGPSPEDMGVGVKKELSGEELAEEASQLERRISLGLVKLISAGLVEIRPTQQDRGAENTVGIVQDIGRYDEVHGKLEGHRRLGPSQEQRNNQTWAEHYTEQLRAGSAKKE